MEFWQVLTLGYGFWVLVALISWLIITVHDKRFDVTRELGYKIITAAVLMPLWYKPWHTLPRIFLGGKKGRRDHAMTYPELADAAAVFNSRRSLEVFKIVLGRLSVTAREVALALGLGVGQVIPVLDCLISKDLIRRDEPEPGEVALYSPTAKGFRVYKGVTLM